jgi:hypothetical protein
LHIPLSAILFFLNGHQIVNEAGWISFTKKCTVINLFIYKNELLLSFVIWSVLHFKFFSHFHPFPRTSQSVSHCECLPVTTLCVYPLFYSLSLSISHTHTPQSLVKWRWRLIIIISVITMSAFCSRWPLCFISFSFDNRPERPPHNFPIYPKILARSTLGKHRKE